MDRNRRIFFLLLINLTLAFLSLYILDFLQIIDYRQILQRVPGIKAVYKTKIENPLLLREMQLDKREELINEKMKNYEEYVKKLEEEKRQMDLRKEELDAERKNIDNRIQNWSNQIVARASYEQRVDEIAAQLENMPPQGAVKILANHDDMMIIDIFRRINTRADEAGQQSQVPYYLSLMDPEQAARIQRKMSQ